MSQKFNSGFLEIQNIILFISYSAKLPWPSFLDLKFQKSFVKFTTKKKYKMLNLISNFPFQITMIILQEI